MDDVRCGRCGKPTRAHGNKPKDSPPGCGWTQSMVLNHDERYGTIVKPDETPGAHIEISGP